MYMQILDKSDVSSEQVCVRQGVFFTAGDKYRMRIVVVWQLVASTTVPFLLFTKI